MRRFALVLALACGCMAHHEIPPAQLVDLDGYRNGGQFIAVHDNEGKLVEYEGEVLNLYLVDGHRVSGPFTSIDVKNGQFSGVLENGVAVNLPLSAISHANMEKNRSVTNVGGLLLISLVAAVAILLAVTYG